MNPDNSPSLQQELSLLALAKFQVSNHDYNEAISILQIAYADTLSKEHCINSRASDGISHTIDLEQYIYLLKDIATSMSSCINGAYSFNDGQDNPQYQMNNADTLQSLLDNVASIYQNVVLRMDPTLTIDSTPTSMSTGNNATASFTQEDIADAYLDWAIAAKNSNRMNDCIQAHLKRLSMSPFLAKTDCIRLLGCNETMELTLDQGSSMVDDNTNSENIVEEISDKGLFEASKEKKKVDILQHQTILDSSKDDFYYCHRPSENAILMGREVRQIFRNAGYTMKNCQSILTSLQNVIIQEEEEGRHNGDGDSTSNENRYPAQDHIADANTFLSFRHDIVELVWNEIAQDPNKGCTYTTIYDDDFMISTKILTYLFLFGLSVKQSALVAALGQENVTLLLLSGLLRASPAVAEDVVADVQIFPICIKAFDDEDYKDTNGNDDSSTTLLFMTDWSLESLRMNRNSIMAVGYDTLELLVTSSGIGKTKSFHNIITQIQNSNDDVEKIRLMDLCCGCGIQGIFAAASLQAQIALHHHNNLEESDGDSTSLELICTDVNKRALHFVTANTALNCFAGNEGGIDVCAIHSDVYDLLDIHEDRIFQCSLGSISTHPLGVFDYILCNPPFVPVPTIPSMPRLCPSLYSSGGGVDGMDILRRILCHCFRLLSSTTSVHEIDDNDSSTLFMVTELPNVEDSCHLLKSLMEHDQSTISSSLSCNYRIRVAYIEEDVETVSEYANERQKEAAPNPDLLSQMDNRGIYNRALVIISITRDKGDVLMKTESKFFGNKYEDAFLTKEGIKFARNVLL